MAYLIIVPALPKLMVLFNVTDNVILQTGTIYEAGKFFGSIIWGVIGDQMNTLKMIMRGVEAFVVLAMLMLIWLLLAPETGGHIVPFFIVFLCSSIASNVSQFCLAVIRLSNTAEVARKWITIDGITAGFMHSSIFIFGSLLVNKFGTFAPFICIVIHPVLVRALFSFTIKQEHLDMCSVTTRKINEDGHGGYFDRVIHLLYSREQRSYQAYVLALSVASCNIYVFPATMTLLFVRYGALADLDSELESTRGNRSAFMISLMLLCSTLAQFASFFLLKYISSKRFVLFGLCSLALGAALLLGLQLFAPPSAARLVVPGVILMMGAGLSAPHCKSGALNSVDANLASTATSLVKLVQISFTLVISFVANLLFNGTPWPVAIIFIFVNIGSLFGFLLLHSQAPKQKTSDKLEATDQENPEQGEPLIAKKEKGKI